MLPGRLTGEVARPTASLYAAARSDWAWMMDASVTWMVPFTWAGGMPWALPGFRPTSPLICVAPVLLIEAVAMTANAPAAPRLIGAWADWVPVVNVQTLSLASGLPARSSAPFAP